MENAPEEGIAVKHGSLDSISFESSHGTISVDSFLSIREQYARGYFRNAIYELHELITEDPEAKDNEEMKKQVSSTLENVFNTLILQGQFDKIDDILNSISDGVKDDFRNYGVPLEFPKKYESLYATGIELKAEKELAKLELFASGLKVPHVDDLRDTLKKAKEAGVNIDVEVKESLKIVLKVFKQMQEEGKKVEELLKLYE